MTMEIQGYLDSVIDERIIPMLKEVSSVFGVKQVTRFVNPKDTPPFFWVYLGGVSRTKPSAKTRVYTYTVNMRLVVGYSTSGYAGQHEGKLWFWLPTLMQYFDERRSLVFQAGQTPPKADGWLLDAENVELSDISPFGVFEDHPHVGIEFSISLPFRNINFAVYGGN